MTSSLERLPPEILLEILMHVAHPFDEVRYPTLVALTLTCKTLRSIALVHLYSDVERGSHSSNTKLLAVLANPVLASYVRRFVVSVELATTEGEEVRSVLEKMTGLREIWWPMRVKMAAELRDTVKRNGAEVYP